ncbi:MAG: N-acetylglucosamine-6-phosphate deacetylase [Planctomycetota bacterium]|nr:MAG: N-acetylglucosamine-6-phosphate deacetylase [Planctomycetota bacterium]
MKIPAPIDLQVNGYNGVDFSSLDLTENDFIRASRQMLQAGTTAFLPTMITSPAEVYKRNLPIIARAINSDEFRNRLLGIHIEGPFISPKDGARGAHNPDWIRKPDSALLAQLIDWADNQIKMITIAAELDGAADLCACAAEKNIVVSLGHQMARAEDLQELVDAGARALTHLGNGVPAVIPRHENPVWAGLANDRLTAMIITDGHHLPPSVIKTIIRTKTPAHCILVSDASPLAGMPPGTYETLGQKVVLDPSGRLYNPKGNHLVGSSATLLQCISHLASLKLATSDQIVNMAFYNPLKLLNIDPDTLPEANPVYLGEE